MERTQFLNYRTGHRRKVNKTQPGSQKGDKRWKGELEDTTDPVREKRGRRN